MLRPTFSSIHTAQASCQPIANPVKAGLLLVCSRSGHYNGFQPSSFFHNVILSSGTRHRDGSSVPFFISPDRIARPAEDGVFITTGGVRAQPSCTSPLFSRAGYSVNRDFFIIVLIGTNPAVMVAFVLFFCHTDRFGGTTYGGQPKMNLNTLTTGMAARHGNTVFDSFRVPVLFYTEQTFQSRLTRPGA